MISDDQRTKIRRLFYAEHWPIGTIARELGLHAETVRAALETARFNRPRRQRRSHLDPYTGFIRETLDQYPRLRATRIHEMIAARGYAGSVVQTRRIVRRLRPRQKAEGYLRVDTWKGEQGQADWGHFGNVQVGRATRPLYAFVMVLSYSRAMHVLFTLDMSMPSFLRGHVEAFAYFGGCPRVLLYDNLKSAVLARDGNVVQFNPTLLELAGHYHFMPKPCAPARGNEKGRVERQIRFLRDRFFAARRFRDVDDLNAQFLDWREQWAHARPCPGNRDKTVAQAFEEERPALLSLPEHPFDCNTTKAVTSGKQPYVRFDRNDYSIPPDRVRQPLTLVASHDEVRIFDGSELVACHARTYDRGATIENPEHIDALIAYKREGRALKGRDRLTGVLEGAKPLLEQINERGMPLGSAIQQMLRLLDDYGRDAMKRAIATALERGTPSPASLAHILEQQQRGQTQVQRARADLALRPELRDLRVPSHNLETYDALSHNPDEEDSDGGQSDR